MLDELLGSEYKTEFLYLKNDKLKYNHFNHSLSGYYHFHNSNYLLTPDKIMNVEDANFIMIQAMYVLIAQYYLHEKGIRFSDFKEKILQNIMISKVTWEFKEYIFKNKHKDSFNIQLVSTKTDSKNRPWFNCTFQLSDSKFLASFNACIFPENLHKI